MLKKDIVVIGASLGGLEALRVLVGGLPPDLTATLFVVVHIGAYGPTILDRILERAGPVPATVASDWLEFRPGHIYVAPSDHHLTLESSGHMRTTRGPKENCTRPAADPLFRSAALAFGPRVTGVILTGGLNDGTAGMWAVKDRGGTVIVQDPQEALDPSMPLSVLKHMEVDHCVPLVKIAPLLVGLANTPAEPSEKGAESVSRNMKMEVQIAQEDNALERGITGWGEPSIYACPECHGVLLQLKEGSQLRFRCHTGHAYSLDTLLAEFTEQTEETLWSAIRSIEETILLLHGMAKHLAEHEHNGAAQALHEKADEAQSRANLVRQAVMTHEKTGDEPEQIGKLVGDSGRR